MIHPSAVVETGAQIDPSAEIGPFCYISGQAKIAAGNKLIARVTVLGDTTLAKAMSFSPAPASAAARRITATNSSPARG